VILGKGTGGKDQKKKAKEKTKRDRVFQQEFPTMTAKSLTPGGEDSPRQRRDVSRERFLATPQKKLEKGTRAGLLG